MTRPTTERWAGYASSAPAREPGHLWRRCPPCVLAETGPSTMAGWLPRGEWAGDHRSQPQQHLGCPRIGRPLRARACGDARRSQLPGPGLQRGRRHAPVHPLGGRRLAHRRRRQRLRRPDLLLGSDAARARAPRGAGRGRGRGRTRHVVRHPHRARGRARRGDRGAYAGRAGPLRLLRHRGDHVRDPARARLHRPRRRRQVRRLLPRSCRRAARLGRLRAGHLRGARDARRPGVLDRADPRAALQRPCRRSRRSSPSTATGSPA